MTWKNSFCSVVQMSSSWHRTHSFLQQIFVWLETAEEEGELVCYLVDCPRNACYCIFVTFARSQVPFCVHCYVVFSIASPWSRGTLDAHRGTGEVFVSFKETKTERQTKPNVLCFETQFKNSISFQIILLFWSWIFPFICKIRLSEEIYWIGKIK